MGRRSDAFCQVVVRWTAGIREYVHREPSVEEQSNIEGIIIHDLLTIFLLDCECAQSEIVCGHCSALARQLSVDTSLNFRPKCWRSVDWRIQIRCTRSGNWHHD